MRIHWLDALFGRVVLSRSPRYFSDGWGPLSELPALLEPPRMPADSLELHLGPSLRKGHLTIREGTFESPAASLPIPASCRTAQCRLVLPVEAGPSAPVCLLLAASGDEGFGQRFSLAKDLARHGIGAMLLENPYYGARRPPGQKGVAVRTVMDLLLMFRAAAIESLSLLSWLRSRGHEEVGVSGFSMGGSLAAYTAALCPYPLAVVPVAAAHAVAPIFQEGVLSEMADWRALGRKDEDLRTRLCEVLAPASITALPPPVAPDCAIFLVAREDGFVPPDSTRTLAARWRGAELREVSGGHVSFLLAHRKAIVSAARDVFSHLARLRTS